MLYRNIIITVIAMLFIANPVFADRKDEIKVEKARLEFMYSYGAAAIEACYGNAAAHSSTLIATNAAILEMIEEEAAADANIDRETADNTYKIASAMCANAFKCGYKHSVECKQHWLKHLENSINKVYLPLVEEEKNL